MSTTVYNVTLEGYDKSEAKQIAERLRQAATMLECCDSGGQFYLAGTVFIDIELSDNNMDISVIA